MRLSEKTLELNLCADLAGRLGGVFWFGLTQKQEAVAGFDACTRIGGRLLLFQFKASAKDVRGCRRFHLPHHQLDSLQKRCSGFSRSVFFVFPIVGTTAELNHRLPIIDHTWLLDVATLPPISKPTVTRGTRLRKSMIHYVDVQPPHAVIHSEPQTVELFPAAELSVEYVSNSRGIRGLEPRGFEGFWRFRSNLSRVAAALVISP